MNRHHHHHRLAWMIALVAAALGGCQLPYPSSSNDTIRAAAAGQRDGQLIAIRGKVIDADRDRFTVAVVGGPWDELVFVDWPHTGDQGIIRNQDVNVIGFAGQTPYFAEASIDAIGVRTYQQALRLDRYADVFDRWVDGDRSIFDPGAVTRR
jgi:hypothetical protein